MSPFGCNWQKCMSYVKMTDKTNQCLNPSLLAWRQWDSNPWPPECHSGALPTELCPRVFTRGIITHVTGLGKYYFLKFCRDSEHSRDIWTVLGISERRADVHQRIRYILDTQIDNSSTRPVYTWHSDRQFINASGIYLTFRSTTYINVTLTIFYLWEVSVCVTNRQVLCENIGFIAKVKRNSDILTIFCY